MIKLTGISDEAGAPLEVQIQAHRELGWDSIESRMIEVDGVKGNLHEVPEATFDKACEILEAANMGVCGFGAIIANWAHKVEDDFSITEAEISRTIPRMQRLGTKLVRVMSYAVRKDEDGKDLADQMEEERFRRMREICKRFSDVGLTVVHENCMNYGGMSISHALKLQENVPGLKWVFDTGNPVFNEDRDHPGQMQNSWDFYQAVRPHIAHVHVKDGTYNAAKKDADYTYPGQGEGQTEKILSDLVTSGYEGYISIEPHVAVVFHGAGSADELDPAAKAKEQYDSYVRYGRELRAMLKRLGAAV